MKNYHEQTAVDDVFFSICLIAIGVAAWEKGNHAGALVLFIFGGFWLALRIYHLIRRDTILRNDE